LVRERQKTYKGRKGTSFTSVIRKCWGGKQKNNKGALNKNEGRRTCEELKMKKRGKIGKLPSFSCQKTASEKKKRFSGEEGNVPERVLI